MTGGPIKQPVQIAEVLTKWFDEVTSTMDQILYELPLLSTTIALSHDFRCMREGKRASQERNTQWTELLHSGRRAPEQGRGTRGRDWVSGNLFFTVVIQLNLTTLPISLLPLSYSQSLSAVNDCIIRYLSFSPLSTDSIGVVRRCFYRLYLNNC